MAAPTTINGTTQIRDATITPAKVTSGIIKADGTNAFSGDQSLGGFKLTNVAAPALGGDAANKTYVDTAVTGLLDFKGSTDCSANPNYPVGVKGDAYYVSVAGKIGGAAGKVVSVGDVYVANADNVGGDEAAVGTSWFVLEGNIAGISANGVSLITAANYAAMRALLDLEAGTDFYSMSAADAAFQAKDATLTAFAALTIAASSLTIGTGADAFSQTTFAANTFPARASTGNLVAKTISDFALTILDDADAAAVRATIGAIGGTLATRETPSGTVNGSNPTFTLANTPTAGTEMIFVNGILQDAGAGNDYTISGATITMLTGAIPQTSDKIRVTYWY